jgi:hypothetical protein
MLLLFNLPLRKLPTAEHTVSGKPIISIEPHRVEQRRDFLLYHIWLDTVPLPTDRDVRVSYNTPRYAAIRTLAGNNKAWPHLEH